MRHKHRPGRRTRSRGRNHRIPSGLLHRPLGIPVDDTSVVGFTAVIQVGAIAAVLVYFFKDIVRIVSAWGRGLTDKRERYHHDYKFAWWVIYATTPRSSALSRTTSTPEHEAGRPERRPAVGPTAEPTADAVLPAIRLYNFAR